MWLGQDTQAYYEDVFSLVCERHKDKAHEIKEKDKICKELKDTFCAMKMKSMSFAIETDCLKHSKCVREGMAKHRIFDGKLLHSLEEKQEYKDSIVLIDSVSTISLALLLKRCHICTEVRDLDDAEIYSIKWDLKNASSQNCIIGTDHIYGIVKKNFEGYEENFIEFGYTVSCFAFIATFPADVKEMIFLRDHCFFTGPVLISSMHAINALKEQDLEISFEEYSRELQNYPYSWELLFFCSAITSKMGKSALCELCCRFALLVDPECCWDKIHEAHLVVELQLKQRVNVHCSFCVLSDPLIFFYQPKCEMCNPSITSDPNTQSKTNGKSLDNCTDSYTKLNAILTEVHTMLEKKGVIRDGHVKHANAEKCRQSVEDQPKTVEKKPKGKIADIGDYEIKNELLAFKKVLTEGRSTASVNYMETAMFHLRKILDMIKTTPEISRRIGIDITAVKFVYGYVCYKCCTVEDMNRAITLFQEIIDSEAKHLAPVYYFLGLSFSRFYKFQTALTHFKNVAAMDKKEFDFNVSDLLDKDSLDEFKYENIQTSLKDEIAKCECPPPPDAVCRYESCALDLPIYFSDLSFKKCTCVYCQERCVLQYHIICWKSVKEFYFKTEKDFLDSPCFTPDCGGLIIKIQIIGKDGKLEKEFLSKNDCKSKLHMKQKKPILENKGKQNVHQRKSSRTASKIFDDESATESQHSKENIKSKNSAKLKKMSNAVSVEVPHSNEDTQKEKIPMKDVPKSFLRPNAVCRYSSCSLGRFIFFNDSTGVYICIRCEEQCATPYHVTCWKLVKKAFSKADDNNFIGLSCFTPDCDGVIAKVEAIGRDGVLDKHFISDNYKPKKRVKQRKMNFLQKLEKKEEQKVRKNQEHISRLSSGEFGDLIDDSEPATEGPNRSERRSKFRIIRQYQKTPIKTFHADENAKFSFATPGSARPRRGNFQPLTRTLIQHDDEKKSDNERLQLEDKNLFLQNVPGLPRPSFIQCAAESARNDSKEETVNLNPPATLEDPNEEELKTLIISRFVDLLQNHGFVSIYDHQLRQEICSLSRESKALIKREGGFLSFIQDRGEFVIMNNNLCLFDDAKELSESGYVDENNPYSLTVDLINVNTESDPTHSKQKHTSTHTEECDFSDEYESSNEYDSSEDSVFSQESHKKGFHYTPETSQTAPKTLFSYTASVKEKTSNDVNNTNKKGQSLSGTQHLKVKHETGHQGNSTALTVNTSSTKPSKEKDELNGTSQNFESSAFRIKKAIDSDINSGKHLETSDKDIKEQEMKNMSFKNEKARNGQLTNKENKLLTENEISLITAKKLVMPEGEKQIHNMTANNSEAGATASEANEKLKKAEIEILNMKLAQHLTTFEIAKSSAETSIQDLKNGLQQMENMYRFMHSTMKPLQDKLYKYIEDIQTMQANFANEVEDQMGKVESGISLSQLTILQTPTFPALPRIDTVLSEMQQSQVFSNSMHSFDQKQQTLNGTPQNGQLPPNSFQNIYTLMFRQNLPATVPLGVNLTSKDLSIPKVSSDQSHEAPSPLQSAVGTTEPTPANDLFSKSSEVVSDQGRSRSSSFAGSVISFTTEKRPLSVDIQNRLHRRTASSEIFQANVNCLSQESQFSHESVSSSSFCDCDVSSSSKSSSLASSNFTKVTSNTELVNGNSSEMSNLDNANTTLELDIKAKSKAAMVHKIIDLLKQEFPDKKQSEIISYIKQYRAQKRSHISILPLATVVSEVKKIIMNEKFANMLTHSEKDYADIRSNKRSTSYCKTSLPICSEQSAIPFTSSWAKVPNPNDKPKWSHESYEKNCPICFEEFTVLTVYRTDCGHKFHLECIKSWLGKQSNCPLCRIHLLLSEEFPTLS